MGESREYDIEQEAIHWVAFICAKYEITIPAQVQGLTAALFANILKAFVSRKGSTPRTLQPKGEINGSNITRAPLLPPL
jgi:hypothetical protein